MIEFKTDQTDRVENSFNNTNAHNIPHSYTCVAIGANGQGIDLPNNTLSFQRVKVTPLYKHSQ